MSDTTFRKYDGDASDERRRGGFCGCCCCAVGVVISVAVAVAGIVETVGTVRVTILLLPFSVAV